jgi:hypothetical protein
VRSSTELTAVPPAANVNLSIFLRFALFEKERGRKKKMNKINQQNQEITNLRKAKIPS